MRFLFIGSRFTLRTSFPRSVTLTQLYFASLVVTNLRRDLHPQVCAHAGRTTKKPSFGYERGLGLAAARLQRGLKAVFKRVFRLLP